MDRIDDEISTQPVTTYTLELTRDQMESLWRAIGTHLDRGVLEGCDVPDLYLIMTSIERKLAL